jgi:hypothetical protein
VGQEGEHAERIVVSPMPVSNQRHPAGKAGLS